MLAESNVAACHAARLLVAWFCGFCSQTYNKAKTSQAKHPNQAADNGNRGNIVATTSCPLLIKALPEAAKAEERAEVEERSEFTLHCTTYTSRKNSELDLPARCVTFRERSSDVIYLCL